MDDKRKRAVALVIVRQERDAQIAKWGDQCNTPLFERLSVLTEEVGELAEAINETYGSTPAHYERGGIMAIRNEAAQVAAVALSIVEATFELEG